MFHKFKKDGKMIDLDNNTGEVISNGVNSKKPLEYFKSTYQIEEMGKTLYSILKSAPGGVLEEHLGTYYEEDEIKTLGEETDTSSVPEVNKSKKRVITYIAD